MDASVLLIRVKGDAARYEQAVRAIGSVASMRLENPEVLKQALAIIDQERLNLRFQASKLIALVVNDYTFTASLRRACPDKATAEALLGRLRITPKTVLEELDGVQVLKMRLAQRVAEDAAALRRVAERILATTNAVERPTHEKRIVGPAHDIPATVRVDIPAAFTVVILGADTQHGGWNPILAGGQLALVGVAALSVGLDNILPSYSAELMNCYLAADAIYQQCQFTANSRTLPNRAKERRCARCMSDLLTRAAACLSSPPRRSFPWSDLPRYLSGAGG